MYTYVNIYTQVSRKKRRSILVLKKKKERKKQLETAQEMQRIVERT